MMSKDKKHIAKPLYKHLKILPLELNIKLLQAKFMKKLILKEHPKIICDKYPLNYNSSINNSDQTKLIVPYFRTNLGTCSLAFEGYKVWKEIPKHIKELSYIKSFMKKYRDFLVKKISD